MTDTPANQAPVETTALAHVYGRAGATTGQGFVKYPANQFAHAVGFTASDKGKTSYIDANGDIAWLATPANGDLMTWAAGIPSTFTPTYLTPSSTNALVQNKSLEDATTYFIDQADVTKRFRFQANGIATATDRDYTVPNKDGTIAMLSDIAVFRIGAVTSTGGASALTITDLSTADYDEFIFVFSELVPNTVDGTSISVQISYDNGATFVTSGSAYSYAYTKYGTADALAGTSAVAQNSWDLGTVSDLDTVPSYLSYRGEFRLFTRLPTVDVEPTHINAVGRWSFFGANIERNILVEGGGDWRSNDVGQVDAIRFTASAGTNLAYHIHIYGVRNT